MEITFFLGQAEKKYSLKQEALTGLKDYRIIDLETCLMIWTRERKKKMKKKFLLSLLVIGMLLVGCQKQSDSKPSAPTEGFVDGSRQEIADSFVKTMADQNFDQLTSAYRYDDAMQKAMEQLTSQLSLAMEQLGALETLETASEFAQGAYIIVRISAIFENQSVSINVVFDQEDQIAGVNFSEYVAPSDAEAITLPQNAKEIETVLIARDGKELPGSITLPASEELVPAVILVHGSGANDRNETLYGNTLFRDLAYHLAEQGIATFRYDKRTYLYGAEMAEDITMTVNEETVNDAVDAVAWLKQQEGIDPDRIYVLGHSLGGLCIGRIAAQTEAAGYIMMAAPVSDLATLMKAQITYLSQFAASEEEQAVYDASLKELEKLNELDQLDPSVAIAGAYPAYWQDLLNYDPIEAAKTISQPVLVLQGEEDYQVPMSEFEQWKKAFENQENWEFHSYSGLSHMMMPGNLETNPNTYYMTKANVDERVVEDLAHFILQ